LPRDSTLKFIPEFAFENAIFLKYESNAALAAEYSIGAEVAFVLAIEEIPIIFEFLSKDS
jgi:hypothetical protein